MDKLEKFMIETRHQLDVIEAMMGSLYCLTLGISPDEYQELRHKSDVAVAEEMLKTLAGED